MLLTVAEITKLESFESPQSFFSKGDFSKGFPKKVAHPTVLGYMFKAQYKFQKTGNHPSKDSQDNGLRASW